MTQGIDNIQAAEVTFPSQDLAADLAFYTRELGFRLDMIFPADDPSVAVLSGHGLRLRLERGAAVAPGALRLLCRDPGALAEGRRELTAPNGVRIQIVHAHPRLETPPTQHAFVVRRLKDNSPWVIGRAGMHYRDLIPGRLGGSIIASHIRIPDAGPVPDMVHYHTVGFQLIFCYHGWVRLVYEDQGPPPDQHGQVTSHTSDILFTFVLSGSMTLRGEEQGAHALSEGDAYVIPPHLKTALTDCSEDLQLLEVSLPADFTTHVHQDERLS